MESRWCSTKTPSTYKDNIEDTDNDSYTSKVTGALIDNQ